MTLLHKPDMTLLRKPLSFPFVLATLGIVVLVATQTAVAQSTLAARITAPIDSAERVTIAHSHSLLANSARDLGAVSATMPLTGMSLVFSRSPQQEAALQALLVAQQQPSSPLYHQWLTPDQYATQFGIASSDLTAAQSWLEQQGFTVNSIGRSRNRIVFSGTAAQVASAFGAPIHNYTAPDGTTRFSPSNDLTIPTALSGVVMDVAHLSSFAPHPFMKPAFTSSLSGSHYLTPGDVSVIYDVNPVYNAGYTGANQSIAVIGESAIYPSDISAFATAAGVSSKPPVLVLVPNSGSSAINPIQSGDEGESDLDVEYSSTMAPGAQVYFVYTGTNVNTGVFSAMEYAIDERIAPIVTFSYGECEAGFTPADISSLDSVFSQAASQGQTVIASAGDSGSTACYGGYTNTATENPNNYALAVNYPASSPYVTAMGGTEIPVADSAASNSTYFTAASGTDIVTSAKSYIPEQVWNDDAVNAAYYNSVGAPLADYAPASGGGGVSTLETRPSWQTGTIGGVAIAAGTYRLLPDISLVGSNYSAPLLLCSSDTSTWSSGQVSSCTKGFRDASTNDLIAAGGTSFDAPIFAGMLALINQSRNATGQGVIGSTLYSLAANSTTYASAFHDITAAGNQCLLGAAYCGTGVAVTDYAATTGYDEASGLGSIDLNNLLTAWPKSASTSLLETVTAVTAATSNPAVGANDAVTITVAQYNPTTGTTTTTPTGTVALALDGGSATSVTLTNGVATSTIGSTVSGTHVLVATYSGDATHAASTGTLAITVGTATTTTTTGTFTLSVPAVTISAPGASASGVLTVTPAGGYTGTVDVYISGYTGTLTNFCISDANNGAIAVTSAAAATDALTYVTNGTTCGSSAFVKQGNGRFKLTHLSQPIASSRKPETPKAPWHGAPVVLAGLLMLLGVGGRRSRLLRGKLARSGVAVAFLALLSLGGLGLSGCSNNSASTTPASANDTAVGTYTITLTGEDSVNTALTSSVTFSVTVQ